MGAQLMFPASKTRGLLGGVAGGKMSFCEFCGYEVLGPCDNARLAKRCQSLRSTCGFCGDDVYLACDDAEKAERCRTRRGVTRGGVCGAPGTDGGGGRDPCAGRRSAAWRPPHWRFFFGGPAAGRATARTGAQIGAAGAV
jgi:hypothetical protein